MELVFLAKGSRFDNRDELCRDLSLEISQTSDETLLVKAKALWGTSCLERMTGDFAFVLYDKSEERFFCARDSLGIKPLYYTLQDNHYHFSGDLELLFEKSGMKKNPNNRAIRSLLEHGVIDYMDTMYEGVFRLPPGCWMVIEKNDKRITRYWHPETIAINYGITQYEAVERFRELFEQAIHSRIDDYETTAFELSGGLDSSAIVSSLCFRKKRQPLNIYSMRFGDLSCDEGEYIDSMASKYDILPKFLHIDQTDYSKDYDMAFSYKVNPHWPLLVTFTLMFPAVHQMKCDGIATIITGQGGDHVMAGSPYTLTQLFKQMRFLRLAYELRHIENRKAVVKRYLLAPFINKRTKYYIKKLLGSDVETPRQKKRSFRSIVEKHPHLPNAFALDLERVSGPVQAMMMDAAAFHVIEKYFGVEYRHPFFDVKLVEFMLSLPPEFKFGRGRTKNLLRLAMKGILPDKIRTRQDKAEFSSVLQQQIDAIDLPPLLDDPLIVRTGWIDKEKIDVLYGKYSNRRISPAETVTFWRYINVEYWYRRTFAPDKFSA
ncbi:asparagine synthase-related protein [Sulfurimonas sp. HSL-1656]|uniref:asparagine synthetase B family protein n=1 Tax=Thiomicrolovo subterrani TaxID=3131934 RepID=UPI0031FA2E59